MNAILSGFVSSTAGCNNNSQSANFAIGAVSAILYVMTSRLFERFKIDDPVDASIVHGVNGIWGVIAVGVFENKTGLIYTGSFD